MDVSLLAPNSSDESLARDFGHSVSAPRVERRLQPDLQFHSLKHP
jgi:hypothetical protein